MDTKWRNAAGDINSSFIKNILMISSIVLTAMFLGIILNGVPHDYNPALVMSAFVTSSLSIVLMVLTVLVWFDKRHRLDKYDDYYRELRRLAVLMQIIPIVYEVLLSLILCCIKLDGYNTSLIKELMSYSMDWIIIALYCLPVLSFELTLIIGIFRWQEKLILNMNKVAEEAVIESLKSERMKIELITNVSHDLKTPLTSITGYLELLKKQELSEAVRDYVDVISMKAGILKEMIEKLFDLAKVSSGNIELNIEKLDMNRMVKQIAADLGDAVADSKKIIKLELTDEAAVFAADSLYMYHICQNLFENALKYSMEGTRIFARTKCEDERVVFEIVNVANYPLDFDKDMIKERFVRADKSRTTKGNGLGLAIVETYTQALGGKFDIEIDGDIFRAVLSFGRI